MAIRGIGVLAAQSDENIPILRKDRSFQTAKFAGFRWVRFNPDVGMLGSGGPGLVAIPLWVELDRHIERCRRYDFNILLTLAVPPSNGDWESVFDAGVFTWAPADEAPVIFLYKQIISRILNDNGWPADRLAVEVANEASRPLNGGDPTLDGKIEETYQASLGVIIQALKEYFPNVRFLSHAMSFPMYADDMVNPWSIELGWLLTASLVPDIILHADIINVHIYYDRVKYRYLLSWDEYRARVVWLFDQFIEFWQSVGVFGSPVLQKPIWITEHGTTFLNTGMNQDLWKWGNEDTIAMHRVAAFDALCQHPRADAVFYYNAMNELEEDDARDENNFGLLRYDGSYTTSYLLMGNANGVVDPQLPAGSTPAEDLPISGY
ncbi:MAG: hypothetical protein K1X67_11880 [Fimbriimonadaceae bacterium]|nr:hypothetical protein [Fimbriimonadaceae bacterium]